MSQRLCAGFNWPELTIPASEPVSTRPSAVMRAGSSVLTIVLSGRLFRLNCEGPPSFALSCTVGVGHPALCTAMFNVMFGANGSYFSPRLASVVVQVGHPERLATCGSDTVALDPSGLLPVALASFAI